jgi:cellulose biosynthesis protein BcsQ
MVLSYRGMKESADAGRSLTRWVQIIADGGPPDLFPFFKGEASGLREVRDAANRTDDTPRGALGVVPSAPELRFAELAFDHANYTKDDPSAPRKRMAQMLSKGLDSLGGGCDLVIFDCPPGFTTLAQAALAVSDAVISPIFEEQLSLWSLVAFRDFGLKQSLHAWRPERHRVLFTRVGNRGAEQERAQVREDVKKAQFLAFKSYIREAAQSHRWTGRTAPDSYTSFNSKYGPVRRDVRALGTEVAAFLSQTERLAETSNA